MAKRGTKTVRITSYRSDGILMTGIQLCPDIRLDNSDTTLLNGDILLPQDVPKTLTFDFKSPIYYFGTECFRKVHRTCPIKLKDMPTVRDIVEIIESEFRWRLMQDDILLNGYTVFEKFYLTQFTINKIKGNVICRIVIFN